MVGDRALPFPELTQNCRDACYRITVEILRYLQRIVRFISLDKARKRHLAVLGKDIVLGNFGKIAVLIGSKDLLFYPAGQRTRAVDIKLDALGKTDYFETYGMLDRRPFPKKPFSPAADSR